MKTISDFPPEWGEGSRGRATLPPPCRRKMRGESTFLLFLLTCPVVFSTAIQAAPRVAASCSQRDVQKALDAAKTGDTVLIPGPCSSSWPSEVTISGNRAVTLGSTGGTVSIAGATALIIHQNASASTRITGLTFVTIGRSGHPTVLVLGEFSPPSATARIDHNTFASTSSGTWIETSGSAPVLIDRNSFRAGGAAEMIHNLAFGPEKGTSVGWTTDVEPGSPNMVFIEDNSFECVDSKFLCNMVQSYYGARTVVRHNISIFSQVDQHGTPGLPWARWWEIYGNTFYSRGLNQCCYMALRGGSGLVWGNTHADRNDVKGGIALQVEAPECGGAGARPNRPAIGQIGRGINQESSPAYFWNNSADMLVEAVQGARCVARNLDYFVASSQPPVLQRCESRADLAAGCPVVYNYIPYTYPYPLDENGLPNPAASGRVARHRADSPPEPARQVQIVPTF